MLKSKKDNPKVLHMVTVSHSLILMKGQINYLREQGFDAQIVSSSGKEQKSYINELVHTIEMKRDISLTHDFFSLLKMIRLLIKIKPTIVNAGTPKAGLLGTLAGFITRVPHRIYTLRGIRYETVSGVKKSILYLVEKITMLCATHVIVISPSLRDEIIKSKLIREDKIILFGKGSSNGINLNKYNNNYDKNLNNDFITLGYVGRIVEDKGVFDLFKAFEILSKKYNNLKLLIAGKFDDNQENNELFENEINNNSNIIYYPHIEDPSEYYKKIDIFVFPTFREGFGNVSIEAQAMGVPVITTDATGARDTIVNNQTGLMYKTKDVNDLVNKIEMLIADKNKRLAMGEAGAKWVAQNFSNELIWEEMSQFYTTLLEKNIK